MEWSFSWAKVYADPFNEVELDVLLTAPDGSLMPRTGGVMRHSASVVQPSSHCFWATVMNSGARGQPPKLRRMVGEPLRLASVACARPGW